MAIHIPFHSLPSRYILQNLESSLGYCKKLIKKPWPYNPNNTVGLIQKNPRKDPRFLKQVPRLGPYISPKTLNP